MSKSLGNLVFVSDLLKVADPRAIRLALDAPPLPRRASSGTTPTSTRAPRCCTGSLAAAERADGADPRPFAERGARRDRRRPRRAARRSKRSTTSRARSSPAATTPSRRRCCASSARCSASTSTVPSQRPRDRVRASLEQAAGTVRRPWPTQITVTLPDGSARESPRRHAPATIAASIGTRPRPRPRWRPRSTASGRPRPPDRPRRPRRDRHARQPTTGARCCATPPRT